MSAKHTPGPWTPLRCGVEIMGSDTHSVVAGEHMAGIAEVYCAAEASTHGEPGVTRISEGEALANLYLIAAAPELLEACKTMIKWDDAEKNAETWDKDQGKAWHARIALCALAFERARAAIAAATGAEA